MERRIEMTFDRKYLEEAGFEGFLAISEHKKTGIQIISPKMGIYVVMCESNQHAFRSESIGGHFKDRNPTVDLTELTAKWVENAYVLYIGKAGQTSSSTTLKKRLGQYINFGKGKKIGHWGGRYIWQLVDCDNLIVAWKSLTNEDPRTVEKSMIANFEAIYGKKPFANIAS
jgi:hypothetical protein